MSAQSTPKTPRPLPVDHLQVLPDQSGGLTLRSRKAMLQVQVLRPDVFRLRWVRGRTVPPSHSWAVVGSPAESVAVKRSVTKGRVSLTTEAGRWSLSLTTGAWELTDPTGLKLFTAPAGATAFAGEEARLALELVENESIFGLGETTGAFNRRGLIRDFWNIDVLGHAPAIHPALKQLYVSIPFGISLRDGRAAGLFWDNPQRQIWDLGQTILDRWQMTAASGEIDLYLFLGPGVDSVVARYRELTGAMPLPPRWGLGYQQSRYSYETQKRVEEIAREFRRRKLPCDVLYLDIHHMDEYRVFTFGKTFPQPDRLLQKLDRQGFQVVTIVDPGVKNDPKFGVLKRGIQADAFVKDPAGKKDYLGEVWPGESRFPDFFRAETREWWGREQRALLEAGVAGFWNDMNEPANFARPDKTLDPECLHQTEVGPRRHREVHNLYGQQMARASREGVLAAGGPDPSLARRPFIITRAGYAGIQRQALVWTGDNSSNWDHLNDAVQMYLNLSLSGVPFCGGDVGGFLENTTPELFVRWFQFATFTPFFRNHSNLGTIAQEPWAFGPEVEEICRTYLNFRYQLLPVLYGLFAEARATGAPIMRPLFWHYQNDPVATACGDQFLLGRDLLVAPILRQGAVARSVYLPNDVWINFWTGERFTGGSHVVAEAPLGTLPLFVRAGSVLPLGPQQQFVGESSEEVVLLHCWPGAESSRSWYEDDGVTQAYEQGVCSERTLRTRTKGRTWQLEISPAIGPFPSRVKTWRLVLWGARQAGRFLVNGESAPFNWVEEQELLMADLPNRPEAIQVQFSSVSGT